MTLTSASLHDSQKSEALAKTQRLSLGDRSYAWNARTHGFQESLQLPIRRFCVDHPGSVCQPDGSRGSIKLARAARPTYNSPQAPTERSLSALDSWSGPMPFCP